MNTIKTNLKAAEVKTNVELKNVIDAILESIETLEAGRIETLSKEADTEIRRSNLAKAVIDAAHKLNELKGIKSVSTMRETLYNLIAMDTNKSKEFHKENNAKQSDTIKDIKDSKKAVLLFSALYPKKVKEVIK